MFPFGSSKFKYPLRKYPEAMACETLVLSDIPADAKELGFVPSVNFVDIDQHDFIEKLYYYRDNPEERKKIAQEGRRLLVRRHSAKVRAKQYLNIVEELLDGN